MIHLTNIKPMGRYRNIQTNQTVNVKKGRRVGRATDVMFFERNGQRVFISDFDFMKNWIEVTDLKRKPK